MATIAIAAGPAAAASPPIPAIAPADAPDAAPAAPDVAPDAAPLAPDVPADAPPVAPDAAGTPVAGTVGFGAGFGIVSADGFAGPGADADGEGAFPSGFGAVGSTDGLPA